MRKLPLAPKAAPARRELRLADEVRELDTAARTMGRLAKGDAVVWFAYPKMSSKRYTSEVNREALMSSGEDEMEEDEESPRGRRSASTAMANERSARARSSSAGGRSSSRGRKR